VGLVLPPAIAPVQVVFLPIHNKKTSPEVVAAIQRTLQTLLSALEEAGVRCHLDDRPHLRIGAKYFEWERRGVPLRVALGERDMRGSADGGDVAELSIFDRVACREEKWTHGSRGDCDGFVSRVRKQLSEMQRELLRRAEDRLASRVRTVESYEEMKRGLGESSAGLFLVPWRESAENEERIKEECKATLRCYPTDRNREGAQELAGLRCFFSGDPATHWALFARAY
jgi:prolyl-tRNA synthetase